MRKKSIVGNTDGRMDEWVEMKLVKKYQWEQNIQPIETNKQEPTKPHLKKETMVFSYLDIFYTLC